VVTTIAFKKEGVPQQCWENEMKGMRVRTILRRKKGNYRRYSYVNKAVAEQNFRENVVGSITIEDDTD
jgi:hypothetical protein